MQPDPAAYLHHLDGFNLSEAQKLDIMRSVHLVMESFVDLAFGTDATQLSLGIDCRKPTGLAGHRLDSDHTLTPTFNDAADETDGGKENSMTDKNTRIAVIYTRIACVLSDADALHARQEEACRAFALSENYDVEAVFRDEGSGNEIERPGLNALLAFIESQSETPVVLVERVDRLARSLKAVTAIRAAIATAGGTLRTPSFGHTGQMSDDEYEDMITRVDDRLRARARAEELEDADDSVQ